MITDKENIVLNSKVVRFILIHLNKKEIDYASNIARETHICYSNFLAKKFKELKREELVELVDAKGKKKYPFIYKDKRNKYYRLTEKGNRIVELLFKIDEELK